MNGHFEIQKTWTRPKRRRDDDGTRKFHVRLHETLNYYCISSSVAVPWRLPKDDEDDELEAVPEEEEVVQ